MTNLRRIACVEIPELPLQILLRAHPDWRGAPLAIVEEERPNAPLILINQQARALRLRTGMRFGAAKSLVAGLRAGAVSALVVEETVSQLVHDLQTFSPHVERDPVSSGVFYVDPQGLARLYGGESNWARSVQRYLRGRDFHASVVVGFGRALTNAISRGTRNPQPKVIESAEETLLQAHRVALERLAISPKVRDALERLGLTTLGDLVDLPSDALGARVGREATSWCRVARGEEILPLVAEVHRDALRSEVEVDPPDADVARLCFALKRGLDTLLESVRQRGQSVRAIWMRLHLERGSACAQRLEPSSPTRDAQLLLELLRLRLSALALEGQVERVLLEAETVDLAPGQLGMFVPRRDLTAGERALARLKASYGAEVITSLKLEEAHLPEAKLRFCEARELHLPKLEQDEARDEAEPFTRRMFAHPIPLRATLFERGGQSHLLYEEKELSLSGPYRVSGGWWVREVERDYYYAHLLHGECWWVFFDRPRAAWFLHGFVD
jgi:protein ImuB